MTGLMLLLGKNALGIILACVVSLWPQARAFRAENGVGIFLPGHAGGITIGPVFLVSMEVDYRNTDLKARSLTRREFYAQHEQGHVRRNYEDPRLALVLDVLSLAWATLCVTFPSFDYDAVPWERDLHLLSLGK